MPKEVRLPSPLIRKKGETQEILGKRENQEKYKGKKIKGETQKKTLEILPAERFFSSYPTSWPSHR